MVVCIDMCGLSIDMYLWDTSILKLTWILTKRLENLSIPFFETTPIFFPFFSCIVTLLCNMINFMSLL
jgi:hypothetical protein